MQITVKDGKKEKIHIYLDGEYTATTTKDFWASCEYTSGDEITEVQWQELLDRIHFGKMYGRALDLLSVRDHSRKELADKLYLKFSADNKDTEVIKEQIQNVCDRLSELGLLNDEHVAKLYADELCRNKHLSPKALRAALLKKGIKSNIVDDVIMELCLDPVEIITELLETKYKRRDLKIDTQRDKTFSSLSRLGFNYMDIRKAMYPYISDMD